MTRHPTDHLDNRLLPFSGKVRPFVYTLDTPTYMFPGWRLPVKADEVIACNKIDNDLQRVVLAHELNRLEKRNGF
jgi:hypothetical protein